MSASNRLLQQRLNVVVGFLAGVALFEVGVVTSGASLSDLLDWRATIHQDKSRVAESVDDPTLPPPVTYR